MKNKYFVIYSELAERIQSGVLTPGDTLPSEHELTDEFQTSRETIRKALHLLAQNGYIQKVRGRDLSYSITGNSNFLFPD